MSIKATYLYNSGFILNFPDAVAVVDYYAQSPEDAAAFEAKVQAAFLSGKKPYVLVTHGHADHFTPGIYSWSKAYPGLTYVVSFDVPTADAPDEGVHVLRPGEVFADEVIGVRAFGSTDQGSSFLIESGDKTLFHAGDLNNWHWNEECPPDEAMGYEQAYLRELEILASHTTSLDAALFPIDPRLGRDHARGARQFLERIRVGVMLPMHFREEYAAANAFEGEAATYGTRFVSIDTKGQEALI